MNHEKNPEKPTREHTFQYEGGIIEFVKFINRNKNIVLAVIGKKRVISGVNLIASHVDSPRLDLKQNPLYEEVDLAFLKTHYYGGIKKYQWLTRPLAIHGKVIKKDGSHLDLHVGESDDDPVFTIADLLPHLSRKVQTEKKVSDAFEGEKLNVLVGSLPVGDDEIKERFKNEEIEDILFVITYSGRTPAWLQ